MLGSLRNNDEISSLDVSLLSTNDSLALSRSEDEVLVNSVDLKSATQILFAPLAPKATSPSQTYLLTNITSDRNSHDDQLRALSSPQNRPEVGVERRDGVDSLEVLHLLLGWGHLA